jgi:signal transduction histidine kinase
VRLRLRTQLLIATVLISSALTAASLLVVQRSVRSEVQRQTARGTATSVQAFTRIEERQEAELLRTAAMLSELPTLKAVMPADPATVQDSTAQFWRLSGSDLLVLAAPDGSLLAVHNATGFTLSEAAKFVPQRFPDHEQTGWWRDDDQLYQMALRPMIAGKAPYEHTLGLLAVGRRIDSRVAQELGSFARGDVALVTGGSVVATTLTGTTRQEFAAELPDLSRRSDHAAVERTIGNHAYEIASVEMQTGSAPAIRCYLLLPADATNAYLRRLNRIILTLGFLAGIVGALLALAIARAMTKPLDNLVGAVRAFAGGDDSYQVAEGGSAEVQELRSSFGAMRQRVIESQRRTLEAARLAALGRAAGSISHDLRHHLAALVANAEFLYRYDELGLDRDESYREVQRASQQMIELIDSLLEVSRDRKDIVPSEARLEDAARRAAQAVQANPEFRSRHIDIAAEGCTMARFDARKLERGLFNLILNACQATSGRVGVKITGDDHTLECRVSDDGPGVPDSVRDHMFEPFVSHGKNNGTGLGLAIASKVVHDHGGEIRVESSSSRGTVMLIRLPRNEAAPVSETRAANVP